MRRVNDHLDSAVRYDQVIATLDLYDPRKETIAIGTAALVLQGIVSPFAVPDVDVLAREKFIRDLKARVYEGELSSVSQLSQPSSKEYRFSAKYRATIEAKPDNLESANLLPFQALTDIDDEFYTMTYDLAEQLAVLNRKTGRRALSPDVVLDWKAKVGRPKDNEFIDAVLSNMLKLRKN